VRGFRPDLIGVPLWQIFASGWFYYHRRSVVAGKSSQLQQNEETLLQKIVTNLLTLHSLTFRVSGPVLANPDMTKSPRPP